MLDRNLPPVSHFQLKQMMSERKKKNKKQKKKNVEKYKMTA